MGFVLHLSLNTNYYTYEKGYILTISPRFSFLQQKGAVQSCGVLWYVVNNSLKSSADPLLA